MSFAKVWSAQPNLLRADIISVEVDITKGLNSFSIVGLPDKGVAEAKDRISAAIKNTGFQSPKSKNQRLVISLAPANLRKEGPVFDLGMALAYLLASKEIIFDPSGKLFLGELSLDGKLRKIKGILPTIIESKKLGFLEIYLPSENAEEAALIDGVKIFGLRDLREIVDHLNQKNERKTLTPTRKTEICYKEKPVTIDLDDIKGQSKAKRGLEIAAAGGHNIALYGPPGTGKTMLSKAFVNLIPPLSFEEIIEVTSIYSTAGLLKEESLILYPPVRYPHHSASYTSVIGGGSPLHPGEITLAHRGILFLDEFPEFNQQVIESLRQPLEEKSINLSRTKGSVEYPADFILIATMNPCPCGKLGAKGQNCKCSPNDLQRYERKLSGPIIDRIDMWIEVSNIMPEEIMASGDKTDFFSIKEKISRVRKIQKERSGTGKKTSVMLPLEAKNILNNSARKLNFSVRSYQKIIKLARTIADLEETKEIEPRHILEALQSSPKIR